MAEITWNQFREKVESRLKELGMTGDVEIEYIDFSWEDRIEDILVFLDDFPQGRKMLTIL